jgi:Na+-translocating ferredoxin:NAD+ oxidoreductase RnfD subunit
MRAIITTKTNTIVDGTLCMAGKTIFTVDVAELPAYKAQALVIEGAELTQYSKYIHIVIPVSMIQTYEFID